MTAPVNIMLNNKSDEEEGGEPGMDSEIQTDVQPDPELQEARGASIHSMT